MKKMLYESSNRKSIAQQSVTGGFVEPRHHQLKAAIMGVDAVPPLLHSSYNSSSIVQERRDKYSNNNHDGTKDPVTIGASSAFVDSSIRTRCL
ncbi:hypothetical protein ECG_07211 [Echinococcus granulosus]|nr:hypothetical protein ECG_07211 [Echinococcus granulosus]